MVVIGEMLTSFDLAPFGKVPGDDFLDVVADGDATCVKSPILPHKTADATHVIPVVTVLVSPEAVHVRVEVVVEAGQAVEILALMSLGTEAAREEQTEVRPWYFVGTGVTGVSRDVAS